MKDTHIHELLVERIVECIEISEQLSVSDPCSNIIEAKGLLRLAYASVSDRRAALRVLSQATRHPADKPMASDVLRGIQAARARQPRRSPLARLFLGGW